MTVPPDAIVGKLDYVPDEEWERLKKIPHKTVAMNYRDEVIDVDEFIAPLIRELWRLNINTEWCCEGYPDATDYRRKAYIVFESCSDAEYFLRIVYSKTLDSTDRLRQSGTPPKCNQYIWKTKPGVCWEYEADFYVDDNHPKPRLRLCLRFPREDIPRLHEMVREYNKEVNG